MVAAAFVFSVHEIIGMFSQIFGLWWKVFDGEKNGIIWRIQSWEAFDLTSKIIKFKLEVYIGAKIKSTKKFNLK